MYSAHKNVQILIALLKKHGIRNIVCSAGTRNISFVFSVLRDDFFKCYSVVDERSAAFFALGLIQTTQEPAAIVCTSGTASANYVSAVNEAYYQHLPLVVLTSDRLRYHLNQLEDQSMPQLNIFHDVIRKVVDLPIVKDDMDAWYCGRLVNEALLELNHREKGPVHINFQVDPKYPIDGGDFKLTESSLPNVTKIERIMADDDEVVWKNLAKSMKGKKILLSCGQNQPMSEEDIAIVNEFCDRYDVVVYNEHLSNFNVKNGVSSAGILNKIYWKDMCPDIVITIGGHHLADPKWGIRTINDRIEHWHVSPNGEVADVFKCQTKIIECKVIYFFKRMASLEKPCPHPYLDSWRDMEKKRLTRVPVAEDFEYSQVYAIKSFIDRLPEECLLHVSNSNSIRIFSYFDIPKSIKFYCNRGTCGIDGSMSSYVAQSYVSSQPSFLCIGDLSFFYDMNALWNNYINGNTRIMLCNNSGGAILNWGSYLTVNVEGAPVNTGAEHHTSAKGWVQTRGFKYLCAHNKKEFDKALEEFMVAKSDKPILLEVFTDMAIDIQEREKISTAYMNASDKSVNALKSAVPSSVKKIIKGILNK